MILFLAYPFAGMLLALGYIVYEVVYLQPRGLDKVSKCRKIIDKEIQALRDIHK